MRHALAPALTAALLLSAASAAEIAEFKIKRQAVFEFASKPRVTRRGDRISIAFETKGFCDVTVAVENPRGKIVRHLASGVLGSKAPAPFAKNAKKQVLIWDGKNDAGRYVDDIKSHTIRVSLGLKPRLERTLFWDPRKRVTAWGRSAPVLFAAAPEGVYVYDRAVFEHLRLFDHDGNYVRTIYPFPADKVDKVSGLRTHKFPHDGEILPLKTGFYQCTLLNGPQVPLRTKRSINSVSANSLAVHGNAIALIGRNLVRLAPDGSSGGRGVYGPNLGHAIRPIGTGNASPVKNYNVLPTSAAFSPDGKTLYMTGYAWRVPWSFDMLHVVTKMALDGKRKPEVFKGTFKYNGRDVGAGSDNEHFYAPTSVACDKQGRVYVSDYMNDRLQVFDAGGKHLKTIPVKRPAKVVLHKKTQEIFVFSWGVHTRGPGKKRPARFQPSMTHMGAFDNPKVIARYDLPMRVYGGFSPWYVLDPRDTDAEIDSWAKELTIWLSPGMPSKQRNWQKACPLVLVARNGKLEVKVDFGQEVRRTVKRATPPMLDRQRLYVNPKSGRLYVGESDAGVGKSFKQAVRIDPDTGKVKLVELPFDCEDMCFDINGLAYLRTGKLIARYDSRTWREVPWDYGEEVKSVGFSSSRDGRRANLVSALKTPGHRSHSFWHMGGLAISPKGHLCVPTCNGANPGVRTPSNQAKKGFQYAGKKYVPALYPGRHRWGEIHIFDQHGKVVRKDAFPGIGHLNGVGIDNNDNIYVMASAYRLFRGKKYDPGLPDDLSETVIKAKPGVARVLSKSRRAPVPLRAAAYPKRPPDIHGGQGAGGTAWVEGAEWFYGGVGYAGKNAPWDGGGCCCWNARMHVDYFARTFAPELRHFSVAVLDTNGNLIMRIGRYGNVDDGKPLDPRGGPPNPRSIGGDEVALFHGAYLAAHTDRRLFIADPGNMRILSVKLGYHLDAKVRLKDVPDQLKSGPK
jgi:SMP-30/Gluconolactonase/LRE-like region